MSVILRSRVNELQDYQQSGGLEKKYTSVSERDSTYFSNSKGNVDSNAWSFPDATYFYVQKLK